MKPPCTFIRGQVNILSLAIAILLLIGGTITAIGFLGVTLSSDSGGENTQQAKFILDALIANDSPLTIRYLVIDEGKLTDAHFESLIPDGCTVQVRLNDTVVYQNGAIPSGTSYSQYVLSGELRLDPFEMPPVSLPAGTHAVTVEIDQNASITEITLNDRIVRYNSAGLTGTYTIDVRPSRTNELDISGTVAPSELDITAHVIEARPVLFEVIVRD